MLHCSNGARRRRGGQKARFLCRSDGTLTDLGSFRERFLLNGVFVQRFQVRSGQAFGVAECWLKEKIFAALVGQKPAVPSQALQIVEWT